MIGYRKQIREVGTMKRIETTENQKAICAEYLNGNKTENDIYLIFKTYVNEYIKVFGWHSWQCDPVPVIVNNFCRAVTKLNLDNLS